MIVVLLIGSIGFAKGKPYAKMAKAKTFTAAASASEPLPSATCNNRVNTELGSNTNLSKSHSRSADRGEGRDQKSR